VIYAQRFGDIFRLHHQGMIASRLSWALMPFRLVIFFSDIAQEYRASTITIERSDSEFGILAYKERDTTLLRNVGSYQSTRRNIPKI